MGAGPAQIPVIWTAPGCHPMGREEMEREPMLRYVVKIERADGLKDDYWTNKLSLSRVTWTTDLAEASLFEAPSTAFNAFVKCVARCGGRPGWGHGIHYSIAEVEYRPNPVYVERRVVV